MCILFLYLKINKYLSNLMLVSLKYYKFLMVIMNVYWDDSGSG